MLPRKFYFLLRFKILIFLALSSGCATQKEIYERTRINLADVNIKYKNDSSEKLQAPYTSDGTTTEWLNEYFKIRAATSVSRFLATGAMSMSNNDSMVLIGIVGVAAHELARKAAIKRIGGENYIKSKSEISFDNYYDFSAWMLKEHSEKENYDEVLKATAIFYPGINTSHKKILTFCKRKKQNCENMMNLFLSTFRPSKSQ